MRKLTAIFALAALAACGGESKEEVQPEPAPYNIVIARAVEGGDLSKAETRVVNADASVLANPEKVEALFAEAEPVAIEVISLEGDDSDVEGSSESYRRGYWGGRFFGNPWRYRWGAGFGSVFFGPYAYSAYRPVYYGGFGYYPFFNNAYCGYPSLFYTPATCYGYRFF